MPFLFRRTSTLAAMLALVLLVSGCSGGGKPSPGPASGPAPTPAGPVRVVVAASEVLVGSNRILLGINDPQGNAISAAQAHLRFFPPGSKDTKPYAETDAVYLGNEQGVAKALYSTRATFDRAGEWRMDAVVTPPGKKAMTVPASVFVMEKGYAPAVGQPFPPSHNQTAKDVPVEQLTSQRPVADPDFYMLTVAAAEQQGKPFMIVVATPAFCETQTCGPQLQSAQALRRRYADRLNFIHIEVFQRPDLLLEGKVQPQVNPILLEWKLQTEPWVFLVDAQGKVFDRFEGYAPESELEASVQRLLGAQAS